MKKMVFLAICFANVLVASDHVGKILTTAVVLSGAHVGVQAFTELTAAKRPSALGRAAAGAGIGLTTFVLTRVSKEQLSATYAGTALAAGTLLGAYSFSFVSRLLPSTTDFDDEMFYGKAQKTYACVRLSAGLLGVASAVAVTSTVSELTPCRAASAAAVGVLLSNMVANKIIKRSSAVTKALSDLSDE